ncbi:MAG TPA: YetF domain-containing protein [Marmoricola sp.]|nr:YetF domain-containing protein [Marmoricola sp.]
MDIVIRSVVVFLVLWLVIRVSGKREVGQLSAFDLILLVTVGDLVSQGVVQEDYSLTAAVLAVSTFALAGVALARLGYRVPATRPVLAGVPRIVVRDGEPVLDVLEGERMTMDDVFEACRKQGIRSLREVELCVLETDGTFSFFTTGPDDERSGARTDHELH